MQHSVLQRLPTRHSVRLSPSRVDEAPARDRLPIRRPTSPCPLISAESITLSAGAVQREHQLAPTPFAQRRIGHRGLEVSDQLSGAARCQQRIGPILHQRGMALDPSSLLRRSAPAIRQFGDPSPQGKCLLEAGRRLADVTGGSGIASQSGGRSVTRRIKLALGQGPTRPLRENEPVAQHSTQRRDVGLQGLRSCAGRMLAPEQLEERLRGHDSTTVQPEHRQDGTWLGARNQDRRTVPPDLKRSQNPEFHQVKASHVSYRR